MSLQLMLITLRSTVYPIMKRVTDFPQAYLGFSMGFGAYIAWTAITGEAVMNIIVPIIMGFIWFVLSPSYVLSLIFTLHVRSWTLHFDTIYACQDRKDDIKVSNFSVLC